MSVLFVFLASVFSGTNAAQPALEEWTVGATAGVPIPKVEDLGVMVELGSVAPIHTLGPGSGGQGLSIYTFAQRGHSVDELVEINMGGRKVTKYDPKMHGDPWRQMWGKDGKWYYGQGHLLAFDPKTARVEDLGTPPGNQTIHWLLWGPDDRIWIGCCTKGTLVAFDPQKKTWDDYGQVGPPPPPKLPHYAEVQGFDEGWVLVHRRNLPIVLAAVHTKTKESRTLFAQEKASQRYKLEWVDGQAYVTIQDVGPDGKPSEKRYSVTAGALKPVDVIPRGNPRPHSSVRMDQLVPEGAEVPKTVVGPLDPSQPTRMVAWWQCRGGPWEKVDFDVPASPERLFRIKATPDGKILGSTYDLRVCFEYDPVTGRRRTLGPLTSGYNVYDFAFGGGKTYMIGYAGAVLFEYDPARSWSRGRTDPAGSAPSAAQLGENPKAVGGLRMKHGHELLIGADGCIYMKGYPSRDDVGGGLAYYDPAKGTNTIVREPFKVLAINGLAAVNGGKIIAISTRVDPDPLRRTPEPPSASIFFFDVASKNLTAVTPFPDRRDCGHVVESAPGELLGVIADSQRRKSVVYRFDVERRRVVGWAELDGLLSRPEAAAGGLWAFWGSQPPSAGQRPDACGDDCLVRLDLRQRTIIPEWRLDRCRMAFLGKDLYFIRGPAMDNAADLFRVRDAVGMRAPRGSALPAREKDR